MTLISGSEIREGDFTKIIYNLIKEQQYKEAITVLEDQLELHPNSRAALSLLGYSYFYSQDFTNASLAYERLVYLFPAIEEYRLYYSQALYHACMYNEAMDATCQIESPEFQGKILKLQAAIKYGADELSDAKSLVDKCPKDDPDTEVNRGCLLYKEGRFDEALQRFSLASQIIGYDPHLSYNIALSYYRLQNIPMAAKHIADIIQNEVSQHPEMGVGVTTEGIDLPSVGNTLTLHETAFIEAFNLKAAFEFDIQNPKGAREALTDMPPRNEEELDAITLHNQAILNMENNPTEGFEKLQFLLTQIPFPPETFGNLLLLYCKYECYDLAADVLADYAHLTYKYLTPFMYDFFDALITQQTSPEEAYRKFDEIANRTAEALRKLTKQVTEAKSIGQDAQASKLCTEYDEMLASKYIPVLMAQAKIFWEKENYPQVEKIFRKSVEFCNEVDIWKLNVAHVIFMKENKFREAASFYEAIVKKSYNHVIDVSAVVLANLCVSYIMTCQNEEAEELMRKIEREEEQVSFENPDQKLFHLCIVNMVIGTLYCAKGNYEFGISRIIKSLEPYNKKLGTDTWFYAKRCFISMIEKGAKHITNVRDNVYADCIQFLEHCEMYGRNVKTVIESPLEISPLHLGKNTVTYEARSLKALMVPSWDYFIVENIPYHGHNVTVLYDRDGTRYQAGSGMQIFVNGVSVARQEQVGLMQVPVPSPIKYPNYDGANKVENYASNVNTFGYPMADASFTSIDASVWQAIDGRVFYDHIPSNRWTNFDSPNPTDWFSIDFGPGRARTLNQVILYVYSDAGIGHRVDCFKSVTVEIQRGEDWIPVENQVQNPPSCIPNDIVTLEFTTVKAQKMRLVFTRDEENNYFVGLTEIEIWAPFPQTDDGSYEAEDGWLRNVDILATDSASGESYVGSIENEDSLVEFTGIWIETPGEYEIKVFYANGGSDSTMNVLLNNVDRLSLPFPSTGSWGQFNPNNFITFIAPLLRGNNAIIFSSGDNVVELDKLAVSA